ncbi:hypothetical protein DD689_29030, partial [Escherichia coli]|uniref:hypothetical protein n=1 Tax=Escherichia coli TaxID=562 RepID=UPI000D67213F
ATVLAIDTKTEKTKDTLSLTAKQITIAENKVQEKKTDTTIFASSKTDKLPIVDTLTNKTVDTLNASKEVKPIASTTI